MTKTRRQILVIALFTTFAVVAPLVLLFASGYSYNWRKQRIEKTGIIYVDAEPTEAQVLLNGKPVNKPMPVSVSRLLPEEYSVRIQLEGYLPWSKNLTVQSGQTTFAKTVVLLPDVLPRATRSANISQSVFSDAGDAVVYLAPNEQWAELSYYDFRTDEVLLLARFSQDKYDELDLSISPDSSHVLLNGVDSTTGVRTIIIYPAQLGGTALEVKELTDAKELNYCWSGDAELILSTPTKITHVTAENHARTLFATTHGIIDDVLCTENNYWLVIEENQNLRLTRLSKDNNLLSEDVLQLPGDDYGFISGKEDLLWLSGDILDGGLTVNPDEATSFVIPDAKGLRWEHENDNGRALLWNDFEIYLIDFVRPEPVLLTRLGTPIKDVAWHPLGTYAIFSTESGITAIELDGRDRRNIYRLMEFNDINSMSVDSENELLRFVGSIGNQRGLYERPL